jgi:uncharacterized membrane protein
MIAPDPPPVDTKGELPMGALAFQRTAVIFLLIGLLLGMKMGMTEDFSLAPVHTHLNLAGGVLMFLAGLFYASRPDTPPRLVTLHYVLHVAGAALLVVGIFGAVTQAAWFGPVVGIGAVLVLLAMLVFAWNVFRRPSVG